MTPPRRSTAVVTGSFGNVGISTIFALHASGYRVIAFDLPTSANRKAGNRFRDIIDVV